MRLTGAGTRTLRPNAGHLAGCGADRASAFGQTTKIEPWFTATVERAERTDSVADAGGQNLERRQSRPIPTLHFCGCYEEYFKSFIRLSSAQIEARLNNLKPFRIEPDPAGTDASSRELLKAIPEDGEQRWGKEIDANLKALAGREGPPVQMPDAQNEGTRCVTQAARPGVAMRTEDRFGDTKTKSAANRHCSGMGKGEPRLGGKPGAEQEDIQMARISHSAASRSIGMGSMALAVP